MENPVRFNLNDRIHVQYYDHWITLLIIFFLLCIIWAKNVHITRYQRIGKSVLNIREFHQMVREEYTMTNSLSIVMAIVFILASALYFYQVNTLYKWLPMDPIHILFYAKIVVVLASVFLLKLLVVRIIGLLFLGNSMRVTDYLYNIFLMNGITGFILIPVVIGMAYLDILPKEFLAKGSAVFLGILFLVRIYRSFQIGNQDPNLSKVYFFAYLCTFEFLPLFAGLKFYFLLTSPR